MLPPVRPNDFESVIYDPAVDSYAEGIKKTYVEFPVIWYKLIRYWFDSNGNITPEFEAELCAIVCPGTTPTTES